METLNLMVPTYYGSFIKGTNLELADFGGPMVPVLIHEAEGVRIALGTHEHSDHDKPDVQIERRRNGWLIFLNPVGGSDTSGMVAFLDDGRSFVVEARDNGTTKPVEMVEYEEAIDALDDDSPTEPPCDSPMIVTKSSTENKPVTDREDSAEPPIQDARAHFFVSRAMINALTSAKKAFAGDSNDDEYEALLAFVDALEEYQLREFRTYDPEWVVANYCSWVGLDPGKPPDAEDIEAYLREARPADSCPSKTKAALREWANTFSAMVVEKNR
jgi:hypothetical protein